MPLYDTSIFIGHLRGNTRTRMPIRMLRDAEWPVFISTITVYELHYGFLISRNRPADEAGLARYLQRVSRILPVDATIARKAAEIQAHLRRRNQMIDYRDLLIAATAVVATVSVCTLDVDHFGRVPGLVLEPL